MWGIADLAAVALWLPPGVAPDADAILSVLTRSVHVSRLDDVFMVLDQMDDAHPNYPHWYLPWLGVHQDSQGTGLGTELLSACLEVVNTDRLPAYLETPNPRTVGFYQRHGFELIGEATAGACPPISCLVRPAQIAPVRPSSGESMNTRLASSPTRGAESTGVQIDVDHVTRRSAVRGRGHVTVLSDVSLAVGSR